MSQPNAMATKKAATTIDNRPKQTSIKGVNAHTSFKMSLNFIFIPLSLVLEAKIVDKVVTNIFVRLPFKGVLASSLWFIPIWVGIPILGLT